MITIIGSLNYDLVTYTDKVPEAGETYAANSFENHLGGKGLNEALACARLSQSGKVRMVGNVGDDSFGKELTAALVEANVDTEYVKTLEKQSSGVAVIMVESSGENRILITAGANGQLKPTNTDYEEIFEESEPGDYVILQNEYPHTVESINWIKQHKPNVNIAYNPSPYKAELILPEILRKIDLLIVNEGEALDVASSVLESSELENFKLSISCGESEGFPQLAGKLQTMLNQENVSVVIITMGSRGSVGVSKSENVFFEKSRKVSVVDTTGAGDTFFGGVVLQLNYGHSLREAVKFATKASSLAIQKKGAAEGIPFFADVAELERK